jgi:rRNA-processing protein FCF1
MTRGAFLKSGANTEPQKSRLVLIDTNCLVRIYSSPLRPILGSTASGYDFKTTAQLANELKNLAERSHFAWLSAPDIQDEVEASVVVVTKAQRDAIQQDAKGIREFGDDVLQRHCIEKNLSFSKSLSSADAKLLAAVMELNASMATDEWPLRVVAGWYGYDDGQPLHLLSSVELLALLEQEGRITRDDRVKTYANWLKSGEKLLRESSAKYAQLFGESPPTAQD